MPLTSAKVPEVPWRPPNVAAVSVPKLRAPPPLVSKVLPPSAKGLASTAVPTVTVVRPVKLLLPPRVSVAPLRATTVAAGAGDSPGEGATGGPGDGQRAAAQHDGSAGVAVDRGDGLVQSAEVQHLSRRG